MADHGKAVTMAVCVASYRLEGRPIEVWRGDALAMPAGAVLFGRGRPLRARLEAMTGRQFEPAPRPTFYDRKYEFLPIDPASPLPWRLAVSLDYRPRNVRVDARQTYPNLTHVDKLSDDVWGVIAEALQRTRTTQPEPLVLLPLSCRNPQVVAVAQVLAIWSTVVDWLPISQSKGPSVFRLVDLTDPSPFIGALEDQDEIITRTLSASAPFCLREGLLERWAEHRFERE